MKYRKLGRYGIRVSEISFGSWISCDNLDNMQPSIEIIKKAYDCGINFFDTADAYSDGRAEIILGEALKDYRRESYVLATKVYWPTGNGPNDRGLSRKHIMESIDNSLRRLKTDYVDIYYCHWFDKTVPIDETLRAMDDIVRQGKALYIGVSNWTASQIGEGLRVCDRYLLNPIAVIQSSYNMMDRYIEKETMPLCEKNGVGIVVYSPLAQGVLTGKYRLGASIPAGSRADLHSNMGEVSVKDFLHEECLNAVEKLDVIAKRMGVSLAQLALAWVLRKESVSSAIIGASRPSQVEENARASGIILSEEVVEEISSILDSMSYVVKHNIIL